MAAVHGHSRCNEHLLLNLSRPRNPILRHSKLLGLPVVTVYIPEVFTESEAEILVRYFTNLDGPVFALVNLPEIKVSMREQDLLMQKVCTKRFSLNMGMTPLLN